MESRRPLLVAAGLSLLAVGVWLNAERLGLSPRPPSLLSMDDDVLMETRFVAYMQQPDEVPIEEPPPEAPDDDYEAGEGTRHKGEEGSMGRFVRLSGLRQAEGERYAHVKRNGFVVTAEDAKSTFSIDVDTASYANVRSFLLRDEQLPPRDAVRTEELVNYFDYDYPQPEGDAPFSVTTEVGPMPWTSQSRLVHIGLQGKVLGDANVPPRNLVFLVDVSGSMEHDLPLVKLGLATLTEQLRSEDHVAIVVYAGAAGMVLPPTSGDDKAEILAAIERLHAGGATNGAEGIELAYDLAREHFVAGGINRVILATDGDFNVGPSSDEELVALIEHKRESGVFLSVLGFGTGNLNDSMMEKVADHGNGNYAYIDGLLEAKKVLAEEASATLDTIAKDVKIQVEFDPAQVKEHRLIGYDNRMLAHADFEDDRKDAGEIGAGHSVTALYEIVPNTEASSDPLMRVSLRYKAPDARTSSELELEIHDDGRSLAQTSNDFRFAAAVAMFAEKLRGGSPATYTDVHTLASSALGDDPHGYRRGFLDLVRVAAMWSGSDVPPRTVGAMATTEPSPSPPGTWAFALEVLRLLPPLLALPLFVLAFRRRRRA